MKLEQKLIESNKYIIDKLKLDQIADTAFILGSGLSYLAEEMENKRVLRTADIPHYPKSTVLGHKGEIIIGQIAGKEIIILSGRIHLYEGYTIQEVVYPIQLLNKLGIRNLILTNAAGGINKNFQAGDLMLLDGYINNLFQDPGINSDLSHPDFFNNIPFSAGLNELIIKTAKKNNIKLQKGVYAAMIGPSFETPAEIRFLKFVGADAVGMSTVPEIIEANRLNMKVAAISCISNLAAGISSTKLTHAEVAETTERIKKTFIKLLKNIVIGL